MLKGQSFLDCLHEKIICITNAEYIAWKWVLRTAMRDKVWLLFVELFKNL